jgi:hypothetical protein
MAKELLYSAEGLRFVELVKGVHSCIATTRTISTIFFFSLCVVSYNT